jgi:hypothetical protein
MAAKPGMLAVEARLAREEVADSQYVLVAANGSVQTDGRVLSLFSQQTAGSSCPALLTAPLSALTIGMSFLEVGRIKILVVPISRGASWICELVQQPSSEAFARTLRRFVGDAHILGDRPVGSPDNESLDQQLERLLLCSGFQSELKRVEDALSRRKARGLETIL